MEMAEDHSLTEGRVQELRRLVQAAGHEAGDDSDEEEDEYDIQIVSFCLMVREFTSIKKGGSATADTDRSLRTSLYLYRQLLDSESH